MRAGADPYKFAVVSLILSMAVVAALAVSASVAILYRAAYREDLSELEGTANSLASVIEAVAQFDLLHSAGDHPRGSWGATMSQVEKGVALQRSSRSPGEVAIAFLEGEEIIVRRGEGAFETMRAHPVQRDSALGGLVRRSFSGERGAVELEDFLGEPSLVGYAAVPSLRIAVLARVGLSEVRAPYVRAASWAALVALLSIIGGAATSLRLARPLKRQSDLQERRLQALIAASPVGVYETDAKGACTFVNGQWCSLAGLSREAALGEGWAAAVHPDDRAWVREQWSHFVSGELAFRHEFRFRHPGGEVIWVLGQAATLRDPEGRVIGHTGTLTDITERKRVEEELQGSVREKETLLHEVHHRVKNNLQIISSLLYFQAKKVTADQDREVFEDLRTRLFAMTLVHERLYRSRDLARVELGDYLRELVDALLQSLSDGGRVRIETRAQEVRLPLQRALYVGMLVCELVTNVVKYAFPGGRSGTGRVSLVNEAERTLLTVEDDGVGFPAGFDPHAAQSFGWTVVRNLAGQLGASIEIGQGSGVQVTLAFRTELDGRASPGPEAAELRADA